ncbi:MAG TPA: tRNA isopentenyl-2-thiomethyl-A-37 hydroxylase MiaE [Polyangiaceae bacterium]|jgi:tRNA-(ms[2]io[6]A)-hydroxylase
MFDLRLSTPHSWLDAVFRDFDAFLVDHAACERKASATGMAFVVRYPDRVNMLEPLIEFAREELEHFHQVYRVIAARKLALTADYRDEYVNALNGQVRHSSEARLLDRLLVAGIVEARGCERLQLVAKALNGDAPELKQLYTELGRAEARHHALFFRLAKGEFGEPPALDRARELLDFEAELVQRLPHRPAVH